MAHDVKSQLTALLQQALASVAPTATETPIHLERPRDPTHGDFATNLAMQLAKPLKRNPRELANCCSPSCRSRRSSPRPRWPAPASSISRCDAGGQARRRAARAGAGRRLRPLALGGGQKVQVEFVSANPTGPLHVGHGRGAAYGASLSSLLAFAGWDVTREYYVNDAGRQMDILGLSTWLRYLELHGVAVPFPPNAYQGDYVRDMAEQMKIAHGDKRVPPRRAGRHARPAGRRTRRRRSQGSSANCTSMR
jgi:arginyl-tRNA synthetase